MNRIHSHWIISVFVVLANTAAGPQIIFPQNQQGDDVRQLASDFYAKIAAGDADGAKAMFDGSADQAEVLDAEIRCAIVTDQLAKSLTAKFGPGDEAKKVSLGMLLRQLGEQTKSKYIVLDGDLASIEAGVFMDTGLDLRCSNGKWKVTYLTIHHHATRIFHEFIDGWTNVANDLKTKVDAGKVASMSAALGLYNKAITSAGKKWVESFSISPIAPTEVLSTLPATAVPSVSELRGLLGKQLFSDDGKRLIASLPSLPHIVNAGEFGVSIYCEDAGICLGFERTKLEFRVICLYAAGADGFSQYPGKLPGGLSFSDVRQDVERKLGRPTISSGGTENLGAYAGYPDLGINIGYVHAAGRDPQNPIRGLTLTKPTPNANSSTTRPENLQGPRFTIRLVAPNDHKSRDDIDMLSDPDDTARKEMLLVYRQVLLDETDVENIWPDTDSPNNNGSRVFVTMTATGAKRLEQITRANIGSRLALVLDGCVLMAPTIRSEISKHIVIDLGRNAKQEDAVKLARTVQTIISTLPPTTEPATNPTSR